MRERSTTSTSPDAIMDAIAVTSFGVRCNAASELPVHEQEHFHRAAE
jgi:hypothetical protein